MFPFRTFGTFRTPGALFRTVGTLFRTTVPVFGTVRNTVPNVPSLAAVCSEHGTFGTFRPLLKTLVPELFRPDLFRKCSGVRNVRNVPNPPGTVFPTFLDKTYYNNEIYIPVRMLSIVKRNLDHYSSTG